MVRSSNDSIAVDGEGVTPEETRHKTIPAPTEPAEILNRAKDKWMRSTREFDVLAPMRRHPLATVALAAAAGAIVASPVAAKSLLALLPGGTAMAVVKSVAAGVLAARATMGGSSSAKATATAGEAVVGAATGLGARTGQ